MEQDKIIKDAQYRKGLSIAFFNATNSAIALVATGKICDDSKMLDEVIRIRDFFLEEHKNYYTTVIANVGSNYKATDTIEKLKATKDYKELVSVWLSLSQDERQDGEIIKVAKDLKAQYEETQ